MAIEQIRRCDVTGKVGATTYQVVVETWDDAPDFAPVRVFAKTVDLGDAGLKRLVKFIERGLAPPKK